MASEIERLIDMLGCGNATPQERIRWAHSIVDLARSEGVAEGAEQEREKILNPLVDKHWNSMADKLREGIVGDLTQLAFLGGKHPEMTWGELRRKYGNPVVDSFAAAVAVQERERIRRFASLIDEEFPEPMYLIHPSVLALTKESEK